jgi:tetratricopeptide (TPR) repeat protein
MKMPDHITDCLSEYLDGELDASDRAAVAEHLDACDACRTTLTELRAVVARASALTDSAPATDLWPRVAEQISPRASPVVPLRPGGRRRFSLTVSFTLPQLAAAVLAVMVLSAGMVWMARLGGERTDFPPVDARVASQDAADMSSAPIGPANFADAAYDEAIADLRQTLGGGRSRLDAETVRVLEENLRAIDQAIEQCRQALASDPANVYLNSHLADAKRRKLGLLRRASALAHSEG